MKHSFNVFFLRCLLILGVCIGYAESKAQSTIYSFDTSGPVTKASRATIEAYLARAMTMQNILDSPYYYDYSAGSPNTTTDLLTRTNVPDITIPGSNPASTYKSRQDKLVNAIALINSVRPKYIHRADGIWATDWMMGDGSGHKGNLKQVADAIHAIDSDIILEAGLFEAVENGKQGGIMELKISDYPHVFAAFQTEIDAALAAQGPNAQFPEVYFDANGTKTYGVRAYNMLYNETQHAIKTGAMSADSNKYWYIPDMSKLATRIWFYYRACEYIKLGFESIHMGRMDLMLKRDTDNLKVR